MTKARSVSGLIPGVVALVCGVAGLSPYADLRPGGRALPRIGIPVGHRATAPSPATVGVPASCRIAPSEACGSWGWVEGAEHRVIEQSLRRLVSPSDCRS